ncbi:hypothetical protein PF001_g20820 [Phytophthora fragariae]|uniref:BRCA2 OB1 domain-containing protein n=1 Tax=Phytophthora fragariae TaxID=53985 RepID=A0A6A4CA29_9STRA|nr:hypothetical protein PF001_g20820 [Phytophthora fragariae]
MEVAAWRAAFDELLVFEQDFDTAMQILMFQDEKVARLSLEDAPSRRRATRTRGAAHSPSRKRRRTGASQAARAEPPSPPMSGFTQDSEVWSMETSAEASQVVDSSPDVFLSADTSTQMSVGGGIRAEDSSGAGGGAGRGGSATMVTSLFTTGSGRAVSVSKERLQAYETKLHAAEESVALSAATHAAAVESSGAGGGAGRGGSATMVTSLFTTGSGRAVSVSKERLQAYETKLHAAEESVALSAATQPAAVDSSGAGGGAGRGGSATMVTSLFTTGSGRAVSVSKERLQAYETKLHAAEESVALSAATHPAAVESSGAGGGAGRGGSATMVTSLFTTGSGRAVSVSKERLQAYETKLHAAEESVALSAATQPAMNDQTLQGDAGTVVSEGAAVLPFPAKNNDSVDQELPPCWNMALVLTDGWYSVNEKRPTIDVCVCVVLVTGRETQDGSSVAAKRQEEISLLDPAIKPKESRLLCRR